MLHQKYSLNGKEHNKEKEKQKQAKNIQKTESKMTDINPIISTSLNVRGIIQPKKRLSDSI